jgi:serine/threonine protein kinase
VSDQNLCCGVCVLHEYQHLMHQYMQRGSLRSVMNDTDVWQEYTPIVRHQILCDIAEGMSYLHANNVFHRDLKR